MRDWLIEARKKHNLSQQEISDKTGITRQMISAIENGTASPSVPNAKKIAAVLNFEWTRFYDVQELCN